MLKTRTSRSSGRARGRGRRGPKRSSTRSSATRGPGPCRGGTSISDSSVAPRLGPSARNPPSDGNTSLANLLQMVREEMREQLAMQTAGHLHSCQPSGDCQLHFGRGLLSGFGLVDLSACVVPLVCIYRSCACMCVCAPAHLSDCLRSSHGYLLAASDFSILSLASAPILVVGFIFAFVRCHCVSINHRFVVYLFALPILSPHAALGWTCCGCTHYSYINIVLVHVIVSFCSVLPICVFVCVCWCYYCHSDLCSVTSVLV